MFSLPGACTVAGSWKEVTPCNSLDHAQNLTMPRPEMPRLLSKKYVQSWRISDLAFTFHEFLLHSPRKYVPARAMCWKIAWTDKVKSYRRKWDTAVSSRQTTLYAIQNSDFLWQRRCPWKIILLWRPADPARLWNLPVLAATNHQSNVSTIDRAGDDSLMLRSGWVTWNQVILVASPLINPMDGGTGWQAPPFWLYHNYKIKNNQPVLFSLTIPKPQYIIKFIFCQNYLKQKIKIAGFAFWFTPVQQSTVFPSKRTAKIIAECIFEKYCKMRLPDHV